MAAVLLIPWLLVGTDCKGRPLRETQIVSFEIAPNPVIPGDSVLVAWQAESVGVRAGRPYCTLQRTFAGQQPEEPDVVPCAGSRTDVFDASITAAAVNYRFSALRRSGEAYETEDIRLDFLHVGVTLSPASATLAPGASQDFTATVSGASDTSVTWDASCGSIQAGGGATVTYTAPPTLDVCLVTATSVANPAVSASATVTVELESYDVALLYWGGGAAVSPTVVGLEARGFEVEALVIGSAESADASLLAGYDLLLIDPFSDDPDAWYVGSPFVAAVEGSGRPVVGLGEGGYTFFGAVESPLGWPNGAHFTDLSVFSVVVPTHPSLTGPRSVGVDLGRVAVANPGMDGVAIYLPDPAPPLELVGRIGPDHYVVLVDAAGVGSALWGFHGTPSDYTDDGWNALANLMTYLIAAP